MCYRHGVYKMVITDSLTGNNCVNPRMTRVLKCDLGLPTEAEHLYRTDRTVFDTRPDIDL